MSDKKVSRRKMLKIAGGAAAAVVIAGGAAYLATKPPVTENVTMSASQTATQSMLSTTGASQTMLPATLEGWQWGTEYGAVDDALSAIATAWNSPEALVAYTQFPDLTESEFALKVEQAAVGGKPPTLYYMVDTTILSQLAYDGYIAEPPSDVLDLVKGLMNPTYYDMLNLFSPTGDVTPYLAGVTVGVSCVALYYNTAMFKAAGLDPTKPPQTWDDLRTAAKALVQRDSTGKMTRAGYSVRKAGNPSGIAEKFIPYAIGNGAKILWKEGGTWYTDINQPPVAEAAQFLHDLIYVDHVDDPDFPSWGYDPFLNGTCAIAGPLGVGFITNTQSENPAMQAVTGVTNIPSPGGIKTAASFGDLQAIGVCSSAPADQQSDAWDFIRFFNTPANITAVSNDIWNWTPYQAALSSPPFSNQETWQALYSVMSNTGKPAIVNDFGPGILNFEASLGPNLARIFTGEISVQDGLNNTYQAWTNYMATSKFYSG